MIFSSLVVLKFNRTVSNQLAVAQGYILGSVFKRLVTTSVSKDLKFYTDSKKEKLL